LDESLVCKIFLVASYALKMARETRPTELNLKVFHLPELVKGTCAASLHRFVDGPI
jgi:hypothetical protein